jgi:uncharacterized delta-60 repeat protein
VEVTDLPTDGIPRLLSLSRIVALVLLGSAPLQAFPDGDFDESFYFDGKYLLPQLAENLDQEFLAVAEAPDGRLVVAGVRETLLGTSTLIWTALDGTTAPTICTVFTAIEPPILARANAIVFDSAGRLLVGGRADFLGEIDIEGIVLRFLYPACTLDTSFGEGGVVRTNFAASGEVHALAVDGQQRVVAAGSASASGFVLRLDGSGDPDETFDGDGRRDLPETPLALDLQDDGKILLAALALGSQWIHVVRLDDLGELDGTFSGNGRVELDFRETERPVGIRLDHHRPGIVVAGIAVTSVTFETSLARLSPDGELDPEFDDDGLWVGYCAGAGNEFPEGLALQSDGRIVVAGARGSNPFVCRLLPDGSPDPSFGDSGVALLPFHSAGGGNSGASAIALRGSGKIALAGRAFDANPGTGAAAQLLNSLIFSDGFERGSTRSWSNEVP